MRAGSRAPIDGTVLEMVVSTAVSQSRFVGCRISEIALLPAKRGPLVNNRTPNRMRSGRRAPVNRTTFEMIVSPNTIGRGRFVGRWETESSLLPAQAGPLIANATPDDVSTCAGTPENGATLEMVV